MSHPHTEYEGLVSAYIGSAHQATANIQIVDGIFQIDSAEFFVTEQCYDAHLSPLHAPGERLFHTTQSLL